MTTYTNEIATDNPVLMNLKQIPEYFLRPIRLFQTYDRRSFRPDAIAGLTVAVVLLPQAIAYALIADLPPEVGLYTAVVAAIVGALWGSSNQLHTGPTNAISLLVLSALVVSGPAGPLETMVMVGIMAVMVGLIQAGMGLARLGFLVNFVSHSVIVGFTAGAGILIAIKQLPSLFGLSYSSHGLVETLEGFATHLPEANWITLALGLGTAFLILLLRLITPKLPGPLISMVIAAAIVGVLGLDQLGVVVIGQLPRGLPPFAGASLFNFELIAQLSTGALAIAAIGLVEAMSISRSIATQTGQRLDSNQEFVGQGLANIASGFFSGYPGSGSFTRSAVNFKAGAKTPMASAFSGVFVLVAMIALSPFAAFVPRASLAGVLIVIAYGMVDRAEIRRILKSTRGDAFIMLATFLATLLLPIEFAVLLGILLSLAYYIMQTSVPQIRPVLPDDRFKHFLPHPDNKSCPQLAVLDILGDLYFGAVSHLEEAIHKHLTAHPGQNYLLLRMHTVIHCDFSGIHSLESIVDAYRALNGDVFIVRVQDRVLDLMKSTGFFQKLGADHFLTEEEAIGHLFHKIMDPAVCIYECHVRAFIECQNLPKQIHSAHIPLHTEIPHESVPDIAPQALWDRLHNDEITEMIIDVREPLEFKEGHILEAQLIPLPKLLLDGLELPKDREIILVCRGGRRSMRAAYVLQNKGYDNVRFLQGGMIAWETNGLLAAIDI